MFRIEIQVHSRQQLNSYYHHHSQMACWIQQKHMIEYKVLNHTLTWNVKEIYSYGWYY